MIETVKQTQTLTELREHLQAAVAQPENYQPVNTNKIKIANFPAYEISTRMKHGDALAFQGRAVITKDIGEDNYDGSETRLYQAKVETVEIQALGYNIPPLKKEERGNKSKSQKLRNTMYIYYHKLGCTDEEFDRIYNAEMDKQKDWWMEKIADLEEGNDALEIQHYDDWNA